MKNIEIGNRVKTLRIDKGMSREQLAERAKISSKFIYDIEHGVKGMSADTLSKLAKALGQSCDFLVNGEQEDDSRKKVMNIIDNYDDKQMTALLHLLQAVVDIHAQGKRPKR